MPKILILSSNPRRDLNLEREVSDLTTAVQRLEKFEIRLGLGVRSQKLPDLLREHSPEFVHFCGHGAGKEGLVFQDEKGREKTVSTEILAQIFKIFSDEINCVVLNACDSDQQSEAIVEHINYVVGMSQPILDQAALIFAVGFYKGLAAGKSIEKSYELGCIAIQLWSEQNSQSTQSRQYRKVEYAGEVAQPAQPNLPEHLKPVLRKKSMQRSSSTALPDLPPGFEEVIRQEIDRKEYKDQARAAYDNFGHFSAENAASITQLDEQRKIVLLGKVKKFWIEGFLDASLKNFVAMRPEMEARPDAIANLLKGIEALSVELDDSFDELSTTRIYEEMGQGRTLLILGDPGAGKTIALLQLAQRLIERSEQNLSLPMPIVFNLSSWAKDRKSIVDWLLDELREKYQVPKSLSEPWINNQQLILLLDGLDEVKEDYRNDCVRALNNFIGLFPQTEVAVCSRARDYEALTERLQISSALCLQPLSSKQVYQFLDHVGGSLAGLKTLLKSNVELEQFAQTPLILNIMSSAYQGWSVEKLINELHSKEERNQHLFNTYIERRLERGTTSEYNKNDVLCWLNWLASRMVQEKQTVFLIEKMQPTWLQNRSEERAYRIRNFISAVLIFGLSSGLIFGLSRGLIFGLSSGLSSGLFAGLIAALSKEILPLEKLSWSWQRAKSRLIREFFISFTYGLIGGLILGLSYGLSFRLSYGLSDGLSDGLICGLICGLVSGLSSGLGGTEVGQQTVPNQGIRSSWRNCLLIGLGIGLIFGLSCLICVFILYGLIDSNRLSFRLSSGLITGLIFGQNDRLSSGLTSGLIAGLTSGLIAGLEYGGGAACIQHLNLRHTLHKKGRIPWDYAKFLDFASDRLLMRKIGGGYVFFHRMLLEHIASDEFRTKLTQR